MKSLRNVIIGAATLAAGGVSAMSDPAANASSGPPAQLIVGVYHPAAPASLTKASFPFGCWYPYGWHGPGYYWCGYRPEGYYAYRPAHYSYGWHRRHYHARHVYYDRYGYRHWRA